MRTALSVLGVGVLSLGLWQLFTLSLVGLAFVVLAAGASSLAMAAVSSPRARETAPFVLAVVLGIVAAIQLALGASPWVFVTTFAFAAAYLVFAARVLVDHRAARGVKVHSAADDARTKLNRMLEPRNPTP